jgi:hypothetical protein
VKEKIQRENTTSQGGSIKFHEEKGKEKKVLRKSEAHKTFLSLPEKNKLQRATCSWMAPFCLLYSAV